MKLLAISMASAGFLVGMLAAFYWWKASRLATPSLPGGKATGISMGATHDWLKDVEQVLNESGRLNRSAALFTGLAVVLTTSASLAGLHL